MKTYLIIVRHSTVTFTHQVMVSNNKKARKYIRKLYAGTPFTIYIMHRIG